MRWLWVLCVCAFVGACQPAAPSNLNQPATPVPFPTTTPGRLIEGVLPTVVGIPLDGVGLANPATAVALANRPTATPDYQTCPGSGSPTLAPQLASGREMIAAMVTYLSEGGSPLTLSEALGAWGERWENARVVADVDFTGEGSNEVLVSFEAPDDGGLLVIFSCIAGRYATLYQAITGGDAPEIAQVTDLNYDGRADILFNSYSCEAGNANDCSYRTQLISWNVSDGRFVSLLNGAITSDNAPSLNDVDNDQVQELVVRLTDDGDATTGPLRTGVNIYDWNGSYYTLSIVQLDPPRFAIQVVQEADRNFARQQMDTAIAQYQLALSDSGLRYWLNDEPVYLKSYLYYRLLLAYAYTDNDNLLSLFQEALATYPDAANAPVYVSMINAFWNGYQVTNNLHSACLEVQAIISARPEAVGLLNRYGNRSPVITAQELCPF